MNWTGMNSFIRQPFNMLVFLWDLIFGTKYYIKWVPGMSRGGPMLVTWCRSWRARITPPAGV